MATSAHVEGTAANMGVVRWFDGQLWSLVLVESGGEGRSGPVGVIGVGAGAARNYGARLGYNGTGKTDRDEDIDFLSGLQKGRRGYWQRGGAVCGL
jgi:hypothetical protein